MEQTLTPMKTRTLLTLALLSLLLLTACNNGVIDKPHDPGRANGKEADLT